MAEPLRHRQTKEAATDMFSLQPPRHIPTLPSLTVFDPYLAHGQWTFMETCWLPVLDGGSIVFIEAMAAAVSPGCAIFTHEFRGAASRVPVEATAFGLRCDHVLVEILATFADRSDKLEEQRHEQWARATLSALGATTLPGGYPNLLAGGNTDRAAKSFGPNAGRLIKAKRHDDPDNIFCSAIPLPASSTGTSRPALMSGPMWNRDRRVTPWPARAGGAKSRHRPQQHRRGPVATRGRHR